GPPGGAKPREVEGGGKNADRGGHDEEDDVIGRNECLPSLFWSHHAGAARAGFDLDKIPRSPPPRRTGGRGRAARVDSAPGGPTLRGVPRGAPVKELRDPPVDTAGTLLT